MNESNEIKVLNVFLVSPEKSFSFKKLRPFLPDMSETPIRDALQKLEADEIFQISFLLGRPKGGNRNKGYRLANNIETFNKVLKIYFEYDVAEDFLNSEYTNLVIKSWGFLSIHYCLKEYLKKNESKKCITKAILSQPATINEFEEIIHVLGHEIFSLNKIFRRGNIMIRRRTEDTCIQSYGYDQSQPPFFAYQYRPLDHLIGLMDFHPIGAILFYRGMFDEQLSETYMDLEKILGFTEGLRYFMESDKVLSPLTSYPFQDPIELIFSRPFDRIFEDAYIFDKEEITLLIVRAYSIYDKFADLLLEYLKVNSLLEAKRLEEIIKEFIFYWNTSVTRFDAICWHLIALLDEGKGSGYYHIKSDGSIIQIIDLENGRELIPHDLAMGFKKFLSLPMSLEIKKPEDPNGKLKLTGELMEEPFDYLKPSLLFDLTGWKSDPIPISKILSDLKIRIRKEKEKQEDPGYLLSVLFSKL